MTFQRSSLVLAAALSLGVAAPAFAHPDALPPPPPPGAPDMRPEWRGGPAAVPQPLPDYTQARSAWLDECRRRERDNGKAVGGALLGGLVGGVIGNRVAGAGNRTAGTVVGAAAGAVVGGAVGASADSRQARDYCEAYLDQYMSQAHYSGYGQGYGYGYGYAYQPVMMMPVAMVAVGTAVQNKDCKETVVTEEWVTVPGRRYIPRRPHAKPPHRKPVRPAADKRVRI